MVHVLFVSFVLTHLSQALKIPQVARLLECSLFILSIGFGLVSSKSSYYGTSHMQHFFNSWRVRNLIVMALKLNKSLKLAETIVSINTRLLRPNTNYRPVLQCILNSSCVVNNAREDPFPLTRIFLPKEVHLRQLVI
jgi:hypothetical protein